MVGNRLFPGLKKWISISALFFGLALPAFPLYAHGVYEVKEGTVKFYSDAPEEIIKAYSGSLKGIVDFSKRTFAFKIGIASFEGFNSALQREHFNENYMETSIYPLATFAGKIVEDINIQKNGTYKVRAKGKMKIHGIANTRIIPAVITVSDKGISLTADFTVLLADHQIKVPRVVNNKLSEEIRVSISAILVEK